MKARRSQGRVRIIGGEQRRLQLPVAEVDGLRPTTDRIRETLFNWLDPHLPGKRVLDAFAGTGALGFEALSRGAKALTAIEQDPRALAMLRENAQHFPAAAIELIGGDARAWLQRPASTQFDIVFLDPPFADADSGELCTLLHRQGWLSADALVYRECSTAEPSDPPPVFQTIKEKTAGQVRYGLYTVAEGDCE